MGYGQSSARGEGGLGVQGLIPESGSTRERNLQRKTP